MTTIERKSARGAGPARSPRRPGTAGAPDLRREVRALLVIAAPLAAAYLAEIAMMITDMVVVGRLGSVQLAAVGLAGDLMIEIMLFCMAIVSIVGVLVAQAIGAGDSAAGAHHLRQGLWLAAGLSIPGMLLCWNLPPLLALTDQDPAVLAFGES
ncbi:MAG: MATE family efflux transporter [Kiloniellales bacterium]|nr:MATE family efflux transporter [Kiloniellales bacterium]